VVKELEMELLVLGEPNGGGEDIAVGSDYGTQEGETTGERERVEGNKGKWYNEGE
jgi:hypothetical protein